MISIFFLNWRKYKMLRVISLDGEGIVSDFFIFPLYIILQFLNFLYKHIFLLSEIIHTVNTILKPSIMKNNTAVFWLELL